MSQAALIEGLVQARWFGGKDRPLRTVNVIDCATWSEHSVLRFVEVIYEYGPPETYVLAEGIDDPRVGRELLQRFEGATLDTERHGSLVFEPTHRLADVPHDRIEPIELMRAEQSNTSIRFGDALILKLFRRVQFGPNPEVEIGRFLADHTEFRGTPALVGSAEYHAPDGQPASLAVLQRFAANRGDAWRTTLDRLKSVLDGDDAKESIAALGRLGRTTAELHVALAHGEGDFSAEPIDAADTAQWSEAIHDEVRLAVDALRRRQIEVDAARLLRRADGVHLLQGSHKIRHHGDYHLGQVLEGDDGAFIIIDFEGEPSKPLALRREKRSALRDVAGMLRSFDYARNAALRAGDAQHPQRVQRAQDWYFGARQAFLDAYVQTVQRGAPALLPAGIDAALSALELEKAAYEVLYELNNRPDWLAIPLAALT